MALPIGTILDGKFKIVQILGEGGMGTVYKVEQIGTPSYFYAVKELLINPNTSAEERNAAIERFNKEIALLRGLKHPNIPSLMLPFQERNNYYFVMEFVPGRSLEKMLEDNKGPLEEEKVIHWITQACDALSYIHSRNPPIILRDLKPGNIMITPNNEVQLIDFGIARRFDPNKRTNTENLGTISYASPEHLGSITAPGQKRSPQNPGKPVQTDARSDIYSLGATMYHLLTNYEPDPIQTPTAGSIHAKNPRLRTVPGPNGKAICPIEQVIIKAMQQEPAQRFQNADAMRNALQHCLPNSAPATTIQIPAMSANSTIVVPATAPQSLPCSKCGFQNRAIAKFCKNCGQPLKQGAITVPPQARVQASVRTPIQARPVQQPVRSSQPIKARPVAGSTPDAAVNRDPSVSGLQLLNSKRYTEAIEQFKLALATKPSYELYFNLGRAYREYGMSLKENDRKLFAENLILGAEQFEKATTLKPNAVDALFRLGLTYRELELYDKAAGAFKKALKLSPTDPAVYYQLGQIAFEQGFKQEAEAYFLEGLKLKPDHTLILLSLGRLYVDLKKNPSAFARFLQVTQQDPDSWEGWYELGRIHMRQNEWSQALDAFEKARQRGPDGKIPDICMNMATCYQKLKRKEDARQMVRETLQRDPKNAEALRLQKQL